MIRTTTSASNFFRRVSCPGSALMERNLDEPPSTRDADKGTELHRLWASPALSRDHLEDKDRESLEMVEKMALEFFASIGVAEGVPRLWEQTFPLFEGTEFEMVNHPDCVTATVESIPLSKVQVGIIDAKFGRIEVDAAEDNWQLAVYAASVLSRIELKTRARNFDAVFDMVILQPWASRQVKPVRMSLEEVRAIRNQILEVCAEGLLPDATYNPTPSNCRYCKGALLGVCPAYHDFALAPVKSSNVETAIRDPGAFLASLHPERRTQFLDALAMADKLGDVIRPAARELLRRDKTAIPGYSVGRDQETRKIANPNDFAYSLQSRFPNKPQDVLGACSLSISAATKLFKAASGLKGKELEETVEKILDPICDKIPRAGSLERE